MKAIYIPQLIQLPEQAEGIEVNEFLPDLETLTPVQGQIKVTHQGSYLEVSVQAETIITLTCDRCLQQYNHRLVTTTPELIWLEEPQPIASLELELAPEDLVEVLSPRGYFSLDDWLYEQLCLAIPLQQLCDLHCPGIAPGVDPAPTTDYRWAPLAALKQFQSYT